VLVYTDKMSIFSVQIKKLREDLSQAAKIVDGFSRSLSHVEANEDGNITQKDLNPVYTQQANDFTRKILHLPKELDTEAGIRKSKFEKSVDQYASVSKSFLIWLDKFFTIESRTEEKIDVTDPVQQAGFTTFVDGFKELNWLSDLIQIIERPVEGQLTINFNEDDALLEEGFDQIEIDTSSSIPEAVEVRPKEATTPRKEATTPRTEATTPTKEETTPTKEETTPTNVSPELQEEILVDHSNQSGPGSKSNDLDIPMDGFAIAMGRIASAGRDFSVAEEGFDEFDRTENITNRVVTEIQASKTDEFKYLKASNFEYLRANFAQLLNESLKAYDQFGKKNNYVNDLLRRFVVIHAISEQEPKLLFNQLIKSPNGPKLLSSIGMKNIQSDINNVGDLRNALLNFNVNLDATQVISRMWSNLRSNYPEELAQSGLSSKGGKINKTNGEVQALTGGLSPMGGANINRAQKQQRYRTPQENYENQQHCMIQLISKIYDFIEILINEDLGDVELINKDFDPEEIQKSIKNFNLESENNVAEVKDLEKNHSHYFDAEAEQSKRELLLEAYIKRFGSEPENVNSTEDNEKALVFGFSSGRVLYANLTNATFNGKIPKKDGKPVTSTYGRINTIPDFSVDIAKRILGKNILSSIDEIYTLV